MPALVLIRGAGDLASGVAVRLHRAGLRVVMTELARPRAVRRTVAFAEAIYEGSVNVEGILGRRASHPEEALRILKLVETREVPVLADPDCLSASLFRPLVIVDARMSKVPPEPLTYSAELLIGLGPGFSAPQDCDAVVETERGHTLGRVIFDGSAHPDSKLPEGDARRILRAPVDGLFRSAAHIGQHFEQGQMIATIDDRPILAPFVGVLRGLLRAETPVHAGMKVGDIDARDDASLCRLVSDKSLAVGGGVLEAILTRPEVRSKLWV